jgi:hypothetical protein
MTANARQAAAQVQMAESGCTFFIVSPPRFVRGIYTEFAR